MPLTLKSIEYGVFRACQNLRDVRLPDALEMIGEFCFSKSSLEELILPANIKGISEGAFNDCEKLEIVWVEEGYTVNIQNSVDDSVAILSLNTMVG